MLGSHGCGEANLLCHLCDRPTPSAGNTCARVAYGQARRRVVVKLLLTYTVDGSVNHADASLGLRQDLDFDAISHASSCLMRGRYITIAPASTEYLLHRIKSPGK